MNDVPFIWSIFGLERNGYTDYMDTKYCTSICRETKVIEHGCITASSASSVVSMGELKLRQAESRATALKLLLGYKGKNIGHYNSDSFEKTRKRDFAVCPTYSKNGEIVVEEWATVRSTYLDNSGPCTSNTSLDATIDVSEYIRRAQQHNEDSIRNAGNEFTSFNSKEMQDVLEACTEALNVKYSFLRDEALQHADPYKYIYDKYKNPQSPFYASDLNDVQRKAAYSNEYRMLKYGLLTGVRFDDSLFEGIHIKGQAKDADERIFNRRMINKQLDNMLGGAGLSIPSEAKFVCTVDAVTCKISISDQTGDGVDRGDLISRIEETINQGTNGKELYIHIWKSCSSMEHVESSQYDYEGWMKFLYRHNIDESSSNGMYGDYNEKFISWSEKYHHGIYSVKAKEVGFDGFKDMNLQIGLDTNGFYDIYQDINWSDISGERITGWYSETEYSALSDAKNTLFQTEDSEGDSENDFDLMSWSPLQEVIDAMPTFEAGA